MIVWIFFLVTVLLAAPAQVSSAVVQEPADEKPNENGAEPIMASPHRSLRKVERVRINDLFWEIEILYPTEKTTINKTYAVYDDNKKIVNDNPYDDYEYGRPYGKISSSSSKNAARSRETVITVENDKNTNGGSNHHESEATANRYQSLNSATTKNCRLLPRSVQILFVLFVIFTISSS